MRSRTSFFNAAMFRKSVSRFWPLWAVYLLVWLLLMPVSLLADRQAILNLTDNTPYLVGRIFDTAEIGGIVAGAIFGCLAAMAVWSFLYSARSAHGMACLPVRREGQFVSAALAGLVPALVIHAAVFLLSLLVELAFGFPHLPSLLTWLAVVTLCYLFFYSFATFCAQLTGSIIILPLVYGVLNFVAVGAEYMLGFILSQFIYGMDFSYNFHLEYFSPAVLFFDRMYNDVSTTTAANGSIIVTDYHFRGLGILTVYGLIGIALLVCSLLLFRRRRMETAGDVVAVKVLKPVFRWCMAIGAGLSLSSLLYAILFSYRGPQTSVAFLTLLAFLLAGAFIGWFAAEMLMKKSFRVFQSRSWAGLGICAIVIVAGMLCARLDLFGYERYIPRAEQVYSVRIYANGTDATLMEPESVEAALALHSRILENRDWNRRDRFFMAGSENLASCVCHLQYHMTNDKIVERTYYLNYEMDWDSRTVTDPHDLTQVREVMNRTDAIANRKVTGIAVKRNTIQSSNFDITLTAVECAEAGGYGSPEEYVLSAFRGFSPGEIATLSPETREELLGQCVLENAINGNNLYDALNPNAGKETPATSSDLPMVYDRPGATVEWHNPDNLSDFSAADFARKLDWNDVYFHYTILLTPAEALRLYQECVEPDIADGTLGLVYPIEDDEYLDHVCGGTFDISLAGYYEGDTPGSLRNEYFYTTLTVDAVRTNAWLAERGITPHTCRELNEQLNRDVQGLYAAG